MDVTLTISRQTRVLLLPAPAHCHCDSSGSSIQRKHALGLQLEPQTALLCFTDKVNYLLDRKVIDKVVIMFIKVTVQRYTVTLIQQVLECVDSLDSQGPFYPILQVRVIKYHIESKRLGSNCHRLRSAT